MISASAVAERVGQLRVRLEAVPHLRPSAVVDALFTELVELCCTTPATLAQAAMPGLSDHAPALRKLCAAGESELEVHWARRICLATDPRAEFAAFPYLRNYRDLVRMEWDAAAAMGCRLPQRIAVLGSGPLPLTGLVLAEDYGVRVLHVDRDLECLAFGDTVTSALGLSGSVDSVLADLESPDCAPVLRAAGLGACDVIVLAALVGADALAKRSICATLARVVRSDAVVLVRSAVHLRSLLYPEVHAEDLTDLHVELEVHPGSDVVNSVLVARPAAG
ncbi:MAG: nicotianamine synthase family protein [Haloechinothrix sp.]